MTLPTENTALKRFIHETFHEIARDEELMDCFRDMVTIIIDKWEDFKDKSLEQNPNKTEMKIHNANLFTHNPGNIIKKKKDKGIID